MKRSTSKKALSWLLALAMVFSMLPAAALAADDNGGETAPIPDVNGTTLSGDTRETGLTEVYVSNTGNNSSTGAEDSPVATIGKAYELAADNATIHVMDDLGGSTGLTVGVTANNGKAITIQGVKESEGAVPTIKAADTITLFTVTSGSLTFKDITLEGQGKAIMKREKPFLTVADAIVTLGKGAIVQNIGMDSKGTTYGLLVANGNGTLTMEDGSIVKDLTAYSGCIRVHTSGAKFVMNGGVIENCDSHFANEGNAIYISNGGHVEMHGGEIRNCGKRIGTANGTIFLHPNPTNNQFVMDGGSIHDNAARYGGGVYLGSGTITLSGNPVVKDNTGSSLGGASNIYLQSGQTVTIGETGLNPQDGVDPHIGIYAKTNDGFATAVHIATAADDAAATKSVGFFHSDQNETAGVRVGVGETAKNLYLAADARASRDLYVNAESGDDSNNSGTKEAPFKTLNKALASAPKGIPCTIHLLSNVDMPARGGDNMKGKSLTICSDGEQAHTIYTQNGINNSQSTSSYFHVSTDLENPSTNLTLENVIVDGTEHKVGNYGEFFIDAGGSLTLGDKVTLQNFTPRAVNVRSGGTFTMLPGSKITGCMAGLNNRYNGDKYEGTANAGGAVYVCPRGTFEMKGGEISGNTSSEIMGGGVFGEKDAIFKMSGAPVVKDNTGGNVYLNTTDEGSQTITVTDRLTDGAEVYVYTSKTPAPGTDVPVATGAESADLNYFHSDNADYAGLIWCNGQTDGNDTTHTDTPITTSGHTPKGNDIFLSVDARIQANIDVVLGDDGTLTITAKDLDSAKYYTVLDKDGVPHKMTVTGQDEAKNDWYSPDEAGTLVFSGLPLDGAPYQVVISGDDGMTEPDGKADATSNGIKVGGQIMALYVAGAAGGTDDKAWTKGDDENGNGTRAKPFLTLTKAYAVLDGKFAQAGIITVLSDIEQDSTLTFKPTTGAIILGEGKDITVQREKDASTYSGLFYVLPGATVTFSNLIVDGDKENEQKASAAFVVCGGDDPTTVGNLTLKNCVVQNFFVHVDNPNASKPVISGYSTLPHHGNITLDRVTIQNNTTDVTIWSVITGGNLIIKDSTITGNSSKGGYAVNVFQSAKLEGKVIVSGNTNAAGAADIYLATGKTLELVGSLTDGSKVGVYTQTLPVAVGDTVPVTSNGEATDAAKFFSDRATKAGVEFKDGKVVLTINGRSESLAVAEQTVIVSNTDPDLWYSLDDGKTWTKGNGGKLNFTGLTDGTEYTVISRDTDSPNDTTGAKTVGKVTTPSDDFAPLKPEDVKRETSQIVINPTSANQQYAVINKETGAISAWKDGTANDADLIFDNLDPDGVYEVVTRDKNADGNNTPSGQGQGVVSTPLTDPDSVGGGYDAESGKASITVNPTDPKLDYIVIDPTTGKPVEGITWKPGNNGEIKFDGLKPETDYIIATRPHGDTNITGDGDAAGIKVTTPPTPVVAPEKDGGYKTENGAANEAKREANEGATDKITIKDENGYSYAVRVKNDDGSYTYYKQSGGANTPSTTPAWVNGAGDHVFNDLPFGQDYEIVKVKTADKDDPSKVAVPAVTPITTLPPTVDEKDVTTAIQDNGKASITVNPASSDYKYVLTDDAGNVVAVKPGNDGSITFDDLEPGKEYKVVTVPKGDSDPSGSIDTSRATDVTTPVTDPDNVTAEIKGDNTVTITVDPAAEDMKYAVVDKDGNVVNVTGDDWKTAENGKVVFEGLTPDTDYEIVAVPSATETPVDNGWGGKGTPIHTPAATVTAPTADQVTKTSSTITIDPTVAGLEYNLMDKDGNIVKTWTPGNGGSITFIGLDPNTQYTVLVRDPNGGSPSVSVKGPTVTTDNSPSGGSSASTTVKVEKAEDGKVKVDRPSAGQDQTVTITVTPDPGFELDTLVVKDKNGKELEVKDLGNGKYSFVMPKDKPVTVTATFRKTGATGDPYTNGVAKLLIVDDHIAYMQGDDLGNFRPTGNITRAETAQLFYNLLKDKNVTGSRSFTDVAADAWYATAVNALANLGIVEGVGDGLYEPERAISRAEFVTIAMRFATNVTGEKTFTDVAEDYWARGCITGAAYYGWINGYEDGTFKPMSPIARAEAATVVNNMLAREGDKDFIDKAEGLKRFPDVAESYWAFYEIVEATNAHDFARNDQGVESWSK